MFGQPEPPTRISQKQFWHGSRTLEFQDESRLRFSWKMGQQLRENLIDLSGFDPNPIHEQSASLGMLLLTFALTAIMLAFIIGACLAGDKDVVWGWVVFGLIFAGLSYIMFRSYGKDKHNLLIFRNLLTGEVFSLFYGKPSMSEFEAFVEALKKKIQTLRPAAPLPGVGGSISQEIQNLVKLRADGVLSEEEFNIAKKRVLGGDTTAVAGFRPASE